MRKITIAPKAERDAAVIAKVRKLRARESKLISQESKIKRLIIKLHEQIALLQVRCPHKRKKWWYGDIAEGWDCRDCGKAG